MLDEILTIVIESAGHVKTESNEIVCNSLLQANIHRLHKQVFVKVKVDDNPHMEVTGKKDAVPIKKTFKNIPKKSNFMKKKEA